MSYNFETASITEHVRQRYVERVRGKNNRTDIAQFSVQNREMIDEDLRKMMERGEELFFGNTLSGKNETRKTHILLCGTWILLVSEDNALVTLYKKDFGFEDEAFNKAYVSRVVKEVTRLKKVIDDASKKEQGERESLRKDIEATEQTIADLRKRIKLLEGENEARKELLQTLNADMREAQNELQDFISNIVGTRLFG